MADKLKLTTNVPVEIAFKFDEGKPFNGEYGDSVMYTLTDDRVWFAPPIVAQKITALGVVKGELVRVTKAETLRGNRRSVEFQVERVERTQEEPTAKAATVTAAGSNLSQMAPQPSTSIHATPSRGRELAVEQLVRAFEVSIDALCSARSYGADKGIDLKFAEQNVISVAMSVYINATKETKSWAA